MKKSPKNYIHILRKKCLIARFVDSSRNERISIYSRHRNMTDINFCFYYTHKSLIIRIDANVYFDSNDFLVNLFLDRKPNEAKYGDNLFIVTVHFYLFLKPIVWT